MILNYNNKTKLSTSKENSVPVEGRIMSSQNSRRHSRVHLEHKILVRINKIFKMSVCVAIDAHGVNNL